MKCLGWMSAAALLASLIAVGTAHGSCPCVCASSVDACLIACPAGDVVFLVIVRHVNNVPLANEKVVMDFSNCPGFQLAPPTGSEPYSTDSTGRAIWIYSDADAKAAFPIRGGGGCGQGQVTVTARCGAVWTRAAASPDQNGDLVVDGADLALVQAKLGTSDASADFDCDGSVTSADVDIAQSHLGHGAGPVSVGSPLATGLAIGVFPNPTSGRLAVALSVLRRAPSALDLIDLGGRSVYHEELGVLSPGPHTLSLILHERISPGLYFLKLSQPHQHVLTKVCILR